MKNEIKQQIEKEALIFRKSEYADSIADDLVDLLSFKKGAEYGYSLARQSVNIELLEALKKCFSVTNDYTKRMWEEGGASEQDSDKMTKQSYFYEEINQVILSASQNQQNEKESDAVEFMNWSQRINGMPSTNYIELYEIFKQSKTK